MLLHTGKALSSMKASVVVAFVSLCLLNTNARAVTFPSTVSDGVGVQHL